MEYHFRNGRVLLPDGDIRPATLTVKGTDITCIDSSSAGMCFDLDGLLVLPGIVDIHGDAFERQLMPRPGVTFGYGMALVETDRQMIANGITTGFHGLTYSWEPGLRGAGAARRFMREFELVRENLFCATMLHLRFETYNLPALDEVETWIRQGQIDMLAFNDHMGHMQVHLENPGKLTGYLARTGLSREDFISLLHSVMGRKGQVSAGIERLAAAAREKGIPMASHDDETPAVRTAFHQLGCRISEFPVNEQTARTARDLGDPIVLGAPNILRGGSHAGRLGATQALGKGLCSVLTSDYFYPSLLHAPFRLQEEGRLSLAEAWKLVSANPAQAVNLHDRGEIRPGMRADLVLVDDSLPDLPRVKATFVAGRPVFVAGEPLNGSLNRDHERRPSVHRPACIIT